MAEIKEWAEIFGRIMEEQRIFLKQEIEVRVKPLNNTGLNYRSLRVRFFSNGKYYSTTPLVVGWKLNSEELGMWKEGWLYMWILDSLEGRAPNPIQWSTVVERKRKDRKWITQIP